MSVLAILLLVLVPHLCSCGQKYEYGLFENFVRTKAIFREEVRFERALRRLKGDLAERKEEAERWLGAAGGGGGGLDGPNVTSSALSLSLLSSSSSSFPSAEEKAIVGALTGMLVLRDTYDLHVRHLSAGRVVREGVAGEVEGGETYGLGQGRVDGFGLLDLSEMANVAFERKWYDTAVLCLREAERLISEGDSIVVFADSEEKQENLFREYLAKLRRLKKNLVLTHNKMLRTRRDSFGEDYKVLPYVIDEETLARSKKQPKFVRGLANFVRDESNLMDWGESERKDEADRRICRGQLVGEMVRVQLRDPRGSGGQRCLLLHHGNPFLRLGPFKMELGLREPFRMVFQDFLDEAEMEWLLEYSRPRLSSKRCAWWCADRPTWLIKHFEYVCTYE